MFERPTIADIRAAADKLGLHPDRAYLEAAERIMGPLSAAYAALDGVPDELPVPVAADRTFHRPGDAENPLSAWYVKTSLITGAEGPLSGKRIALKDNICLAGVPLMAGAAILEGYVPDIDATIVTRMLAAGAEIAGKAVCEYYCLSGGSHTSSTGPVHNPYRRGYSAGGSSSGSAALVASGDVDMAIGGDQAGSIRIPASNCGIVGMKPTFGLVPYTGIFPLEMTIDHAGPMTKTVADNALLLETLAGPDGLDGRQGGVKVDRYTKALHSGASGLRIGILREGFGRANSDPAVDDCVRQAAAKFSELGAMVAEVSVPLHNLGFPIWAALRNDSCVINLLEMNGLGMSHEGVYPTGFVETASKWRHGADAFADTLKISSLFGRYSLDRYGGRYYAKAQNLRRRLRAAYDAALDAFDLLLLPTIPLVAQAHPARDAGPEEITRRSWEVTSNTCPTNVTGHPAISLPCGRLNGLPVGVMLIGRHWRESTIYQAASAFEAAN